MRRNHRQIATSGLIAVLVTLGANGGLFPLSFLQPQSAIAQNADEQVNIRVYERAAPAVVSIETEDSNGSGSIISADGLVLTNAHVIGNARSATVILADGQRRQAEILGFGANGLDLAVLRIRGARNLPTLRLASSGSVRVGQRAFAIGNPFGRFQGTFTTGIVSRLDEEKGLIQTDAAINPGNSGGPLLNSQGELIGVNTAIFSQGRGTGNIGIGFAIAVNQVQPFLTAVREGRAPSNSSLARSPLDTSQPPQPLALNGSTIRASLSTGDNVLASDNSRFDVYSFDAQAGTAIEIQMASQDIDPYLILIGPDNVEVAQDDDGGGDTTAKIIATLPKNGTYRVIANSYQGQEFGAYTLQARTLNNSTRDRATVLLQQEGVLGPNASILPSDGSLYQEYTFAAQAGQTITLSLESPDFDTYLILLDPNGRKIAENDDASPTTPNSQLAITLPRSGRYRAIVNAYDRSGRGRYRLTVRTR